MLAECILSKQGTDQRHSSLARRQFINNKAWWRLCSFSARQLAKLWDFMRYRKKCRKEYRVHQRHLLQQPVGPKDIQPIDSKEIVRLKTSTNVKREQMGVSGKLSKIFSLSLESAAKTLNFWFKTAKQDIYVFNGKIVLLLSAPSCCISWAVPY